MSNNNSKLGLLSQWWVAAVLLGILFLCFTPLWAGPPGAGGYRVQGGKSPVVILSDEFFQTMDKLSRSQQVYGDKQEIYLEQIATAQRFLVKTNLALLEQNEKIVRLLEELNRQRQGEKR